jgi:hypothetical protein
LVLVRSIEEMNWCGFLLQVVQMLPNVARYEQNPRNDFMGILRCLFNSVKVVFNRQWELLSQKVRDRVWPSGPNSKGQINRLTLARKKWKSLIKCISK